jgi:hypothetical protein
MLRLHDDRIRAPYRSSIKVVSWSVPELDWFWSDKNFMMDHESDVDWQIQKTSVLTGLDPASRAGVGHVSDAKMGPDASNVPRREVSHVGTKYKRMRCDDQENLDSMKYPAMLTMRL